MAADDDEVAGEALFAALSEGLRAAQQLVRQMPAERQPALQARLIAITNSSKHDLETAHRRLEALLSELDPDR